MDSPLLSVLLQEKLIDGAKAGVLMEESQKTGKSIEALIDESGQIEEEKLAEMKGRVFNLPYVNLVGKEIKYEDLNIISKDVAENNHVVAFEKLDGTVNVGMINPGNIAAMESINFLAKEKNFSVKYFIISPASFRDAVKKYEILKKEVEKVLEIAEERFREEEKEIEEIPVGEVAEAIKKAPVSKMVAMIMKYAVDNKASDIHIEPAFKESRVRYRIDGVLRPRLALPAYIHAAVIARIKVLANLKLDETRIPQDGRIRQVINGRNVDFRISTLPLMDQEKVVMRVLETATKAISLEDLGFRGQAVEIISREIKRPHGLLLVTGPTGSGKSTTLYTALSMVNREGINIVTLEDPIEYYISGINQSQIRPEIGFSFAAGLRSLLRQDPNIIMVGEIRDNETAELAIHAALTGHLIFSTLHTNDAAGSIPRLIDMKVEPFLLSSTLNVVIAQRLVRKICSYCKEEITVPAEVTENIKKELASMPKKFFPPGVDLDSSLKLWHGAGCTRCNNEGYIGRVVISEVLEVTDNLKRIIAEGFNIKNFNEERKNQGMVNMKQDGFLKVLEGLTTVEEVLRATQE
ncbi:MAG: GspE/PulE family protein [Patescibacteria group bacterium]|jgi:type IV pilus assembly protein PilB